MYKKNLSNLFKLVLWKYIMVEAYIRQCIVYFPTNGTYSEGWIKERIEKDSARVWLLFKLNSFVYWIEFKQNEWTGENGAHFVVCFNFTFLFFSTFFSLLAIISVIDVNAL